MITRISTVLLAIVVVSCSAPTTTDNQAIDNIPEPKVLDLYNPPAEGFNMEGSDQTAMLIADKTLVAMGGRASWDQTHVISWNFFGSRKLLWDKKNNKVRVDYLKKELNVALDMNDMSGKVWKNGQHLTNEDSVDYYLKKAKSAWINDSYWLVMPFKLKDSGVTLGYVGEDTTNTGIRSDVLRLTFEEVGDTPQNAYHVWIDFEDRLVRQWAWYVNADDTEPRFVLPWGDYKSYGDILLSGERGDKDITEIKVLDQAPKGIFEELNVKV